MSEEARSGSKESFSSMKQWLITKFQTSVEGNQQAALPQIVISMGSDKSINKMVSPANSPVFRRPSPLTKSWTNYKDASPKAPRSVPHNTTRTFWGSSYSASQTGQIQNSFQPGTHQGTGSFKSNVQSVPCTPTEALSSYRPNRMALPENNPNKLKSPLLRFQQRNNIPIFGGLSPSPSTFLSRSELDSDSLCGACGQHKYYGSGDLIGFDSNPMEDSGIQSEVNSPKFDRRQLNLRRTSSCRAPEDVDKHIFQKSAMFTKAASNVDVQKRPSTKPTRVKRTGSKESNRSTVSLTRSLSINLDTFRIVRNNSQKPHDINARKLSLNDNELRRTKEDRRRSSILRLFCHEKSDCEEGKSDSISNSSNSISEEEIFVNSPKITRTAQFVNSDPLFDFRSTFESDTVNIPSVYGQIKIMFQYFNEKNELQLTILKGSNVAPGQTGTLGVYTKVCLMPGKLQKKLGDDKHDTRDPVFYEPFTFKMSLDELLMRQLRIKLYNKPGIFSVSEPIGECSVPLYHYDLTAVTVIWQNLSKSKGQKDDMDQFDFTPLQRNQKKRTKFRHLFCGLGRQRTDDTEEA